MSSPPTKGSGTSDDRIRCRKCGSDQVQGDKKGFGVGKAALGALVIGPLGLVAGGLGSSKVLITCLACGNKWKPGR